MVRISCLYSSSRCSDTIMALNKENPNIKEKMFCCFFLSWDLWDYLYIKYKLEVYGSIKNKTMLNVLSDINTLS